MATYNERNEEILDTTPVEMPIGYERPESLASMIARMINSTELQRAAQKQGLETFEESDDFEMDDDGELVSPYQLTDMQEDKPYAIPAQKPTKQPTMATNQSNATQPSTSTPSVAPAAPPSPEKASA